MNAQEMHAQQQRRKERAHRRKPQPSDAAAHIVAAPSAEARRSLARLERLERKPKSEPEQTTRYAVRLRSRHTGREITLGVRYDTREDAEIAGKAECDRCNSIDIVPAWD